MDKNTNPKNLKIFFIKLISICIAIIITINALFNILISGRFSLIEQILSLSELENRREIFTLLKIAEGEASKFYAEKQKQKESLDKATRGR